MTCVFAHGCAHGFVARDVFLIFETLWLFILSVLGVLGIEAEREHRGISNEGCKNA